jgi:hypothetical protein
MAPLDWLSLMGVIVTSATAGWCAALASLTYLRTGRWSRLSVAFAAINLALAALNAYWLVRPPSGG